LKERAADRFGPEGGRHGVAKLLSTHDAIDRSMQRDAFRAARGVALQHLQSVEPRSDARSRIRIERAHKIALPRLVLPTRVRVLRRTVISD
jgi:hypothetical protein